MLKIRKRITKLSTSEGVSKYGRSYGKSVKEARKKLNKGEN